MYIKKNYYKKWNDIEYNKENYLILNEMRYMTFKQNSKTISQPTGRLETPNSKRSGKTVLATTLLPTLHWIVGKCPQ